MSQLEIDYLPGLQDQFPEFIDCVRASVYGCGRAFKGIAADLDMSTSELSRKLAENPNDPINFPLKLLPALLEATGDARPVMWLVSRFMEDRDIKRKRAAEQLIELMPQIQQALKVMGQ